jgi:hypothetical protein
MKVVEARVRADVSRQENCRTPLETFQTFTSAIAGNQG